MKSFQTISIDLSYIKNGLKLVIDERKDTTLFISNDWMAEGEAQYQIKEGCFYEYEIIDEENKNEYFFLKSVFLQPNIRKPHLGIIAPNIYVGTLTLDLFKTQNDLPIGKIKLEVQSVKSDYRTDYRYMLKSITERCTDLIMQIDSPINQHFETDFNKNPETLYQRFSFVKSLIDSLEFEEAIHKIVSNPTTKWEEECEIKDIRSIRRFNQKNIKQLVTKSNRMEISNDHFLNQTYGLTSIPTKIDSTRKTESIDTVENRFIKHALEELLFFCENCELKFEKYSTAKFESGLLATKISTLLNQSFFKQISRPTSLKLNSPVLQRKSGYREVLNAWLKFDLAAKLIWQGGDNVYDAGKKDIATLYEYWLFFTLLELLKEVFEIEPKGISELIKQTPDGLNLQIKQGEFTALNGVYDSGKRKLNIRFNYNRSFTGKKVYPESGSWTTTLRPDYTLSFWPFGITEAEAEKQELIVHIHFDAKYKVDNLNDFINQNTEKNLNDEKIENRKGIYKNADLLKMHAYKDAIRRTGGAYVLYPGDKFIKQKGFHEIIPGLGAFPVKPSESQSGIGELKAFILEIIDHFINRASQREKAAYRTYDIHLNPPNSDNIVNESLPEPYGKNRNLLPDETFVLIGFYNSPEQYDWITRTKLYNFRMGSGNGSLELDLETVSSKYLLLHTNKDQSSSDIWEIISKGPKVYSNKNLVDLKYPSPSQDSYLIIKIKKVEDPELLNLKWNFRKLKNYRTGSASAYPFTASLSELIKNAKEED